MRFIALFLTLLSAPSIAFAFNLDWSGIYRIEGVRVDNSELDSIERSKAYINHHLILKPRAVVADGLNVYSRFDIFNNSGLPNSQFGQFFGNGVGNATQNSSDNSNVLSQNQADESILVTELYMTYDFEFMQFVVGRAPIHFGLGMTHNAGNGLFDHWFDNRDLIALDINMGTLKIRPMYTKVSEGELDIGDDIREYIFQIDYENLETDTAFGIFFQSRRSGHIAGNDFPSNFGTGTFSDGFDGENINFFMTRGWNTFRFGLEGGFSEGKTKDSNGTELFIDGFGLALEFDYMPEGSKWKWNLMTGFATGDDGGTATKAEGFQFDRNYEVGLLMYNHVLGQFDALTTALSRNTALDLAGTNGFTNAGSVPDMESVGNTIYIAPGFTHKWKDNWTWGGRLIYGVLNETNISIGGTATKVSSDLGFETDFNLTFTPHDRFTWSTDLGLLFPGSAFKGGDNGFETKFAYGFVTKVAISF